MGVTPRIKHGCNRRHVWRSCCSSSGNSQASIPCGDIEGNPRRQQARATDPDRPEGASGPSRPTVSFEYLDKNQGSAGGYAAGIARSLEIGAKFLWLLDDDNQVEMITFAIASAVLNKKQLLKKRKAVSCLRTADPNHLRLAAGESVGVVFPKSGEFFGFDFLSRMVAPFHNRPLNLIDAPGRSEPIIPMAPYGGPLTASEDVRRVGLRNIDFIVYCDDHDVTQRLVACGVQIRLAVDARVSDASQRWDGEMSNSNLHDMIRRSSDWCSYYLSRNVRIQEWDLAISKT